MLHVNLTTPHDPKKTYLEVLAKLQANKRLHRDLKSSIWGNFSDWEYLTGKEVYKWSTTYLPTDKPSFEP
jgi:hypothetical protein